MPKTKFQGVIFGILMSITMAYGMEVFNVAHKLGYSAMPGGFSNMTNHVFYDALIEASFMWIFVFIFSNLWGNRIGHGLAAKLIDPKKDNPFFCTLVISGCTVLIMCPTMSAVAAILFNIIMGGAPASQFPAIWVGTVLKNFPMALLWNLFAAGPFTRFIFRKLFAERNSAAVGEAA
ncbi:DUF2798 domain-containing protein [Anaerotignum sp.]